MLIELICKLLLDSGNINLDPVAFVILYHVSAEDPATKGVAL